MKITAETTDEELNKTIEVFRTQLTQAVANGDRSETLAKAVNSVAEAEGKRAVFHAYREAVRAGSDPEAAWKYVIQQHLLVHPNDTWSGRANDARRSYFDGVRDAVSDLRDWRP